MPDIEGKVTPHVGLRGGDGSSVFAAELEQAKDAIAAQLECGNEVIRGHFVAVDAARHRDAVLPAEGPDPHATSIVDVAGDHPEGAARRSRHGGFPEFRGQVLDQKYGYPVIGLPGAEDRISEVGIGRRLHWVMCLAPSIFPTPKIRTWRTQYRT